MRQLVHDDQTTGSRGAVDERVVDLHRPCQTAHGPAVRQHDFQRTTQLLDLQLMSPHPAGGDEVGGRACVHQHAVTALSSQPASEHQQRTAVMRDGLQALCGRLHHAHLRLCESSLLSSRPLLLPALCPCPLSTCCTLSRLTAPRSPLPHRLPLSVLGCCLILLSPRLAVTVVLSAVGAGDDGGEAQWRGDERRLGHRPGLLHLDSSQA